MCVYVPRNSSKDESGTRLRVSILRRLRPNNPRRVEGREQSAAVDLGPLQVDLRSVHVGLGSGVD